VHKDGNFTKMSVNYHDAGKKGKRQIKHSIKATEDTHDRKYKNT